MPTKPPPTRPHLRQRRDIREASMVTVSEIASIGKTLVTVVLPSGERHDYRADTARVAVMSKL